MRQVLKCTLGRELGLEFFSEFLTVQSSKCVKQTTLPCRRWSNGTSKTRRTTEKQLPATQRLSLFVRRLRPEVLSLFLNMSPLLVWPAMPIVQAELHKFSVTSEASCFFCFHGVLAFTSRVHSRSLVCGCYCRAFLSGLPSLF